MLFGKPVGAFGFMGFVFFEALGFQFLALPVVVARAEVQRLGSKLHETESIIWSSAADKPISTKAWSHVSSKGSLMCHGGSSHLSESIDLTPAKRSHPPIITLVCAIKVKKEKIEKSG